MSRVDIFGFSRSFIDELEKKKGKSLTEKEKNQLLTQKGGRLLQFFRPEEITSGMCVTAVSKNGSSIEFVPKEYVTDDLYELASRSYRGIISNKC